MFTGIVETLGVIKARSLRGPGARLAIGTGVGPLELGESIAVQGVCLTVQSIISGGGGFECDASSETLACSTLGDLPVGSRVHLERALALGGRLGGHIVAGHVDGKVRLSSREKVGEADKLVFEVQDRSLCRFIAPKGSVAIDGVSLTVNGASADRFDVVIIPHTLQVTTLGSLATGHEANLEVDLLARYVARLLSVGADTAAIASKDESLRDLLKTAGFV